MEKYEERINKLEEELKLLKRLAKGNPFDVKDGETAYYNDLGYDYETDDYWKEVNLNNYIPCKDKSIVEARQRNHKLYDMLQRKAVETETLVTEEMWKDEGVKKWYIYYDHSNNEYDICHVYAIQNISTIYFTSPEVAEQAIKEIVEPFMRGEL